MSFCLPDASSARSVDERSKVAFSTAARFSRPRFRATAYYSVFIINVAASSSSARLRRWGSRPFFRAVWYNFNDFNVVLFKKILSLLLFIRKSFALRPLVGEKFAKSAPFPLDVKRKSGRISEAFLFFVERAFCFFSRLA